MRKLSRSVLLFLLALVMLFSISGILSVSANADDKTVVTVAKPKFSVNVEDGQVTLTVKKTKNALGYEIYVRPENIKEYTYVGNIDLDGTKKRKHTIAIDNSKDGIYYVRIRAFNGSNYSKYSKSKKVIIHVTVAKPKFSVNVDDGQVTLTVKKTKNALGYEIYVRPENIKEYTYVGNIDLDGTKKRKHTIAIDNSKGGVYYVRIRAFNGSNYSKYSKSKKVIIQASLAAR